MPDEGILEYSQRAGRRAGGSGVLEYSRSADLDARGAVGGALRAEARVLRREHGDLRQGGRARGYWGTHGVREGGRKRGHSSTHGASTATCGTASNGAKGENGRWRLLLKRLIMSLTIAGGADWRQRVLDLVKTVLVLEIRVLDLVKTVLVLVIRVLPA